MKYLIITLAILLALLAGSDDAAISLTAGGCAFWLYKFVKLNLKTIEK